MKIIIIAKFHSGLYCLKWRRKNWGFVNEEENLLLFKPYFYVNFCFPFSPLTRLAFCIAQKCCIL